MSLRYVLLALLSMEPNTGYGLGRRLRGELSHLREARLQQIYAELSKLQGDGLVDVEAFELPKRPAKKVYSVTEAGEAALDRWLITPALPPARRDNLLVRVFCLARLDAQLAVQRIEERLEESTARLVALQARLPGSVPRDRAALGKLITLEAALAHAEADVAWCSRALDYLRGAAARGEAHREVRTTTEQPGTNA